MIGSRVPFPQATALELRGMCRERVSPYRFLLLVGSSVLVSADLVGDYDLVAISGSDDGGDGKQSLPPIEGKAVEVTSYSRDLPAAFRAGNGLLFFLFREAQKMRSGILLDGTYEDYYSFAAELLFLPFPVATVEALIDNMAKLLHESENSETLFNIVRTGFLAAGFIYSPIGPLKPKWMGLNIVPSFPRSLKKVIALIQGVYNAATRNSELLQFLTAASNARLKPGIRLELDDAVHLVHAGYLREATFPMHAAALKMVRNPECEPISREQAQRLCCAIDGILVQDAEKLCLALDDLSRDLSRDVRRMRTLGQIELPL